MSISPADPRATAMLRRRRPDRLARPRRSAERGYRRRPRWCPRHAGVRRCTRALDQHRPDARRTRSRRRPVGRARSSTPSPPERDRCRKAGCYSGSAGTSPPDESAAAPRRGAGPSCGRADGPSSPRSRCTRRCAPPRCSPQGGPGQADARVRPFGMAAPRGPLHDPRDRTWLDQPGPAARRPDRRIALGRGLAVSPPFTSAVAWSSRARPTSPVCSARWRHERLARGVRLLG